MNKTMEMFTTSPEWVKRFQDGDWEWMKAQLKDLVPIEDD